MVDYVLEGPKWGGPGLGTAGGVVTWAIDATVSASFLADIRAAFADWSAYGNIQFSQVSSTASSMIDFTFGAIDGHDNIRLRRATIIPARLWSLPRWKWTAAKGGTFRTGTA